MSVTFSKEDRLPHIAYQGDSASLAAQASLHESVASTAGRLVIISFAGCSLVVEYSFGSKEIDVSIVLETPLANITLGHGKLDTQHPSFTIGGSVNGFKAEGTIEFDFATKVFKATGTLCTPAGCKTGSIHIHV